MFKYVDGNLYMTCCDVEIGAESIFIAKFSCCRHLRCRRWLMLARHASSQSSSGRGLIPARRGITSAVGDVTG